ncbi:hypothetical protein K469DRAFT_546684, partial [Zopfia rhizophila CBS 207.26]
TARNLPLLDSFTKESARLIPVGSLSTRRQVLKPFCLNDGTKLEVGDWACMPARALMQNGLTIPSLLGLNGFRFVDPKLFRGEATAVNKVMQSKPHKLKVLGATFMFGGPGALVWNVFPPGRYHVSAIMKMLVTQTILDYDIELVGKEAR